MRRSSYHSDHLVQHLASFAPWCCCRRAFRREKCSNAANLSVIAEELHQCLGACYHLSSARNLKLHNPHTIRYNGCPDFNRTRCAPIYLRRREEAITIRLPEVAAGDSEATVILGICRTYAHLKL